jgi:beta-N-acetylhexosaminidase
LAAVRAIQAGADVLLLPPDAAVAINEVERAVHRGDISETRIDRSLRKVLNAKSRLGLHRKRTVSIDRIGEIVASPEHMELAQVIADHSITAAKDALRLLPIHPLNDTRIFSLSLSPGLDYSPAAVFQAEMRRRFSSIRTAWVNARIPQELSSAIQKYAAESDIVVLSTVVRLGSDADPLSIPGSQRRILELLRATNKPLIWVAFGNPYALRLAPAIGTYLCTFSYSDESQTAAAKALAGAIEINGKMPVSVPPYVKAGDGLQIPKIEMRLLPLSAKSLRPADGAFENVKNLLASYIDSGLFPGAQLLAGLRSRILLDFYTGAIGPAAGSGSVSPDTVYDTSFLTRNIGIASAVMLALDSRRLAPDFPVSDFISDRREIGDKSFAIQDLWRSFSDAALPETEIQRNEEFLEEIVSRVSGTSWERLLRQHLFEPLGLRSTYFIAPEDFRESLARSGAQEEVSLFSNARDTAVFAQLMLNRGMYNHRRYFRSETVDEFAGPRGVWSKPASSEWSGRLLSSSAFGHYTSAGSFLWMDPEKQLFVVFLTNGSPEDIRIPEAQRKLAESVVSAILN